MIAAAILAVAALCAIAYGVCRKHKDKPQPDLQVTHIDVQQISSTTTAETTSSQVTSGQVTAQPVTCSPRTQTVSSSIDNRVSQALSGLRLTTGFSSRRGALRTPKQPQHFDAFLTHDWGDDELSRSNHARVARVNEALKQRGLVTWFDEERMRGDINAKMADGIDRSSTVLCFITQRYIAKVGGQGVRGGNDNCKFEFDYALNRRGVERIVPIVMEERCRNPTAWQGVVGGKLGGKLHIDMVSDDDGDFDGAIERVATEISHILADSQDANGAAQG